VKLDIEDDCILGRVITMLVDMGFPKPGYGSTGPSAG
jgi:hypothetical protein